MKKIDGKIIALIAFIILLILAIYKIPDYTIHKRLNDLGYDEKTIEIIIEKYNYQEIIKNDYYSDFLSKVFNDGTYNPKYLQIYLNRDSFDEDDQYLYERLKEIKNYSDEELTYLYKNLNYISLRPLVVFDKLNNLDEYINDCKAHPTNTLDSYIFSNDYLHKYENVIDVKEASNVETFVSYKTNLNNYQPEKLVSIPTDVAISGLYLKSEALDQYTKMCNELFKLNMGIYAYSAYYSYDNQKVLFDLYKTEKEALDNGIEKPGFKDKQLGLSVSVMNDYSYNSFNETDEYKWLKENSYKYGFIFRYPENKEAITGHYFQDDYLRYVGIDLAKKIYDSKMTFDEYYYMYLSIID